MARVLIVEDDIQVLMLAESVLQQSGHDTLTAATVAEAQSIINSDKELDLVFTDVQLSNHPEGGIQLCVRNCKHVLIAARAEVFTS